LARPGCRQTSDDGCLPFAAISAVEGASRLNGEPPLPLLLYTSLLVVSHLARVDKGDVVVGGHLVAVVEECGRAQPAGRLEGLFSSFFFVSGPIWGGPVRAAEEGEGDDECDKAAPGGGEEDVERS